MHNITDGGPAFPRETTSYGQSGMSLRDYFAAKFLATVRIDGAASADEIAAHCYVMADAMLRARSAQSPRERQDAHLAEWGK